MGAVRRVKKPQHQLYYDPIDAQRAPLSVAFDRSERQVNKKTRRTLNQAKRRERSMINRFIKRMGCSNLKNLGTSELLTLRWEVGIDENIRKVAALTQEDRLYFLEHQDNDPEAPSKADPDLRAHYFRVLEEYLVNEYDTQILDLDFSGMERKIAQCRQKLTIRLQKDEFPDPFSRSNYHTMDEAFEAIMAEIDTQYCFDPSDETQRDAVFSLCYEENDGDIVIVVYGAFNDRFLYDTPYIESLIIEHQDQEVDKATQGRTLIRHRPAALKVA